MEIWRLKAGEDRRFRSGHPWVYSNELAQSPKGTKPGEPIELHDASGKFLAYGYGNPHSLIAFRAMSRVQSEKDALSREGFEKKFQICGELRRKLGLGEVSHRLCFGEADGAPGLVVDRYRIAGKEPAQVFVIQAHSAGIDRMLPAVLEGLEKYVSSLKQVSWARTAIVVRNDLGVRKLEGIEEEGPRVVRPLAGVELENAMILVCSPISGGAPLSFRVDLVHGQKTGFFLDQAANIELAASRFSRAFSGQIKILDLCCYVGQWGAKLAHALGAQGVRTQVTAVDASARALELAKFNIEAQGGACETFKGDVLRDLDGLAPRSFDLVICDPPALIKSRKDVGPGTHAYLQLNTQAARLVRSGGGWVSCSCSALMDEEEFVKVLSKAAFRNSLQAKWVGRGSQASDHAVLASFPEGRYLKGWIGFVEELK